MQSNTVLKLALMLSVWMLVSPASGTDIGPQPVFVFEFTPELPNTESATSMLVSSWTYAYPDYSDIVSELSVSGSTFNLAFNRIEPDVIPRGPYAFRFLYEHIELGHLAPGEYQVHAEIHDHSTIVKRGSVSFTVIPEPNSLILIAIMTLFPMFCGRHRWLQAAR